MQFASSGVIKSENLCWFCGDNFYGKSRCCDDDESFGFSLLSSKLKGCMSMTCFVLLV